MIRHLAIAVALLGAMSPARPASASCKDLIAAEDKARIAAAKVALAGEHADVLAVMGWAEKEVAAPTAKPTPTDAAAKALLAALAADGDWSFRLENAARTFEELAATRRADADAADRAGTPADAARFRLTAARFDRAAAAIGPTARVLELDDTATLNVVLTNPPTTRLRLSFDRTDGVGHEELEWDPAVGGGLGATVTLPRGVWQLSPSVEPTFVQQGAGSIVIAAPFTGMRASGDRYVLTATHTALVADKATGRTRADQVAMTGWPQPTLTISCLAQKLTIEDQQFGPAARAGDDARAFGAVAPAIVTETLSILAEIAVERARSAAMDALKRHFLDPVCEQLTLGDLKLAPADDRVLPRTCELLRSLRLEDALASGDAVLRSLRDDLRLTVAPALLTRHLGGHAVEPLAQGMLAVANSAIDRGAFGDLEAQLALQLLANIEVLTQLLPTAVGAKVPAALTPILDKAGPAYAAAKRRICGSETDTPTCIATVIAGEVPLHELLGKLKPTGEDLTALKTALVADLQDAILDDDASTPSIALRSACHARLAVAVVKRCTGARCSADEIGKILASPSAYFAPDSAFPASLCWKGPEFVPPPPAIASLQRVVIEGIELTAPVRNTTGRERAAAAVRLMLTVFRHVGGKSPELEIVGEIAVALIDERYDTALSAAIQLIERLPKVEVGDRAGRLRKLARLVGAVSSYVSVYRSTKDQDPEAARKARKAALEALIDGATDRRGREGDGITSIGSNVGVGYAFSYGRDAQGHIGSDALSAPALRLPLGVSYQRLPGTDNRHGWHLGLQLVDLGQFVATGARGELEDPTWSTFVAPGVEAGVDFRLTRTASATFNVSLHATYAPSMLERTDAAGEVTASGAWRFGVAVGYYVPFFDLN